MVTTIVLAIVNFCNVWAEFCLLFLLLLCVRRDYGNENFMPVYAYVCVHVCLSVCSMKSLDDMFSSGLYINDLSMHDSSRDLVLAGTQQSAELKLALDQVRWWRPLSFPSTPCLIPECFSLCLFVCQLVCLNG